MVGSSTFPHPVYAQYVLEPGFHEAQRMLFEYMISASEAHVLMLVETGNLPAGSGAALLRGLAQVGSEGADSFTYQSGIEDLFFAVEQRLMELVGADVGGNFQIARSRNDLDAAMCRMRLRDQGLAILERAVRLWEVLLDLADQHVDTLMLGITHTQPAQPTTLGHYLLGVAGPLERDVARLLAAWDRVNASPLGVAAFTTTSFTIDRELTAELLGFDGLVENGYDAVGASDHMMETTGALATMVGSLSRFVHDLLIWARVEAGFLRVDDSFIQISSIMPQKRNPVVLEHIGIRIGWVYGDASTVATIVHSSAFGDTNDVNDPMYVPLDRACESTKAVLDLLTTVLETASFDVALLEQRAAEGNATTTAVAELLVREGGISWRAAHTVLSGAVGRSLAEGKPVSGEMVLAVAADTLDSPVSLTARQVESALDAWDFVRARTLPGGPAPETTRAAIASARSRLRADVDAISARREGLATAAAERARRTGVLVASVSE
jgi:argininosuccinate lyase